MRTHNENQPLAIEPDGPGRWRITAVRQWRDDTQSAAVLVHVTEQPDTPRAPAALAGSLAWLALGQARLIAQDSEGAITCAERGLAELGANYASRLMDDDTDLKLQAARERIAQGALTDGAALMLRILALRTRLHAHWHRLQLA